MPAQAALYAVAYRPVLRLEKAEIEILPATLAVGDAIRANCVYWPNGELRSLTLQRQAVHPARGA